MSRNVFAVPMTVKFEETVCQWSVSGSGRLLSDAGERERADIPVTHTFDAFAIRDEFLSIRSEDELLPFLRRTGVFSAHAGPSVWTVESLMKWQTVFKQLLQTNPSKWARIIADDLHMQLIACYKDFKTRFIWKKGAMLRTVATARRNKALHIAPLKHAATISCNDTLGAMLASVYVDHMTGAVYKFCSRDDCGKPFLVESAHERLYCSNQCAHVVVCRRTRAREKSLKTSKRP